MAKFARFYGWTFDEIESLEYEAFQLFSKAITVIEAREALLNMQISDYPQMKKKDRNKVHRNMIKSAYYSSKKKPTTTNELAEKLARSMNGR